MTVLLAGGLSWTSSEVRDTPLYEIFVGRLFGVVPAQAFWALAARHLALVHPQPPPIRRSDHVHRRQRRRRAGDGHQRRGDANPAVHHERHDRGVRGACCSRSISIVFFPTQGGGFLLPALAAVFIGGTSIAGGLGSIVGTFFGAYIIGSLEAGVVATGISGYWVQLVEGVVMGASVVLNIVIGRGPLPGAFRSRFGHWTCACPRAVPPAGIPKEED